MSIRSDKTESTSGAIDLGYEGTDVPDDFIVPSCTIEDADRAVFALFDQQLPMQFVQRGETKKIPVIFATGERFAVLNRRQPLRDKNKTLILPLISIMRTGIKQSPDNGLYTGELHTSIIKKRISRDSDLYKRLINKIGLHNQTDAAHAIHVDDGKSGTRRTSIPQNYDILDGKLLTPDLEKNLYEIITIPPVKHYQSTYSVTFWAQYLQQANDMMAVVMSMYQNNYGRTFKLETPKGYWFVGYVSSDFTMDNNYEDFTDSERLIKVTFDIKVNAYLVMPDHPGSLNGLRRLISAPTIEFSTSGINEQAVTNLNSRIKDNNVDSYILDDLATSDDSEPGQAVGVIHAASAVKRVGVDAAGASIIMSDNHVSSVNIGGHGPQDTLNRYRRLEIDPFTGKPRHLVVKVGHGKQRKGETVYKEGLEIDLGDL